MNLKAKAFGSVCRKRHRSSSYRKKRLRIFLFALAGALLAAAAAVFIAKWLEGTAAAKNAQALLSQSGILSSAPFPSGALSGLGDASGEYERPESPQAENEDQIMELLADLGGYTAIARLDIESLGVHLPVLCATSDEALEVSVCYYSGPAPGQDGNLVITGHNYRNGAHFGTLDQIKKGDNVSITDTNGNTFHYVVYRTENIAPDAPEKLDDTLNDQELTLMTCTARGNMRLLVRCKEQ